MKKLLIAASLAALTLAGGVASAAPRDHGRHEQTYRAPQHRSYVVDGRRFASQPGPAWQAPRAYHQRAWSRGQRLPTEYRRVVVRDYHRYHLPRPARGQQWVRVGNDVLLVSIASGVIGAVIAGAFY